MLRLTEPFWREEACPLTLILLVEDDQDHAQLFSHVLSQEADYYVVWATNGLAALRLTQHVKPQLFLLDYYLPSHIASIIASPFLRLDGRETNHESY